MQNSGMPPPLVTWVEGLSTETVGEDLSFWPSPYFGPKTGLNLSEDLFLFFWSSPNFGQEKGLGLWLENFCFGLHYSQIFWIFCPPPPPPPLSKILLSLLELMERYLILNSHPLPYSRAYILYFFMKPTFSMFQQAIKCNRLFGNF